MKSWILGLLVLCSVQIAFAQAPTNRFTAAIAQKSGTGRIAVTDKPAEKRVDIEIDGKLFTSYHYGPILKRPTLFPVNSPKGNPVTRGYPLAPRPYERVDNPNQIGLWMGYGNINGVDFWNDKENPSSNPALKFGTIVHKAVKRATGGKQVGTLEVESEWVDDKGKAILKEVTLYVFEGTPSDRIITRTTTLTGLQEALFVDTKDGFFGMRLGRELEQKSSKPAILTGTDGKPQATPSTGGTPTGEFINSESQKLDSVYGKRAEWVFVNGQIGAEPLTIAFFDFPQNLAHPPYWNATGSGLFAINPMGQADFSNGVEELDMRIPLGKSLTFKHMIRIQSGRQLTEADCERVFTQFSKGEED